MLHFGIGSKLHAQHIRDLPVVCTSRLTAAGRTIGLRRSAISWFGEWLMGGRGQETGDAAGPQPQRVPVMRLFLGSAAKPPSTLQTVLFSAPFRRCASARGQPARPQHEAMDGPPLAGTQVCPPATLPGYSSFQNDGAT